MTIGTTNVVMPAVSTRGDTGPTGRRDDRMNPGQHMPDAEGLLGRHAAVAHAPTLLMATAHLTGDHSLLRKEWQPRFDLGGEGGGYTAQVAEEIRRTCRARLLDFARSGAAVPPRPDYDALSQAAGWLMGRNMDVYIRAIKNAVLFEGEDPCAPRWSKAVIAPDRPFQAVIIGAGASGLLAAYRMKQAGIPFVVIEKNADVGGVWEDNSYPGARVDLNSFVYSYSFAQKIWRSYYGEQWELAEYFRTFAREHGLYENIRLNTEVESCVWDEARARWAVRLGGGDTLDAKILISAVGQLSRPKIPDIAGLETFGGPHFHSARWNHEVDLRGKRVGVIGNAASAMQFIPRIADEAERVEIFMRTPNWLLPQPLLHREVDEAERWMMRNLPYYGGWYRAFEYMSSLAGFPEVSFVDPDFPPTETATSAANAGLRAMALAFIEGQIADRPDLRPFTVPDYPITGKRVVADNGAWIGALKRDDISVVQSPIARIDRDAVVTRDGAEHDIDILIYATGFRADEFLMPITFVGRDGVSLHDKWAGEARAYLGMTVPQFPNLFLMYGPNTNLLVNLASIINLFEGLTNYVMDAARHLLSSGADVIEVRPEIYDAYNERLDRTSAARTWQWSSVSSWYKGPNGRSAQNYPFTADEFIQRTAAIDPTDFITR